MPGKKLDDYAEDLDKFISKHIKKIPYDRLPLWKEMLFRPRQTIKNEMGNASLAIGAKDIALASLAYLVIIALIMAEYMGIFIGLMLIPILASGVSSGLGGCIVSLVIVVLIAIAVIIAFIIFSIIGWLFYAGIEFLLARVFGGKGEYRVHAYLESILNAATLTAMVPFMALYIIPCFIFCNAIIQPFMMAVGLYTMYVRYLIVKQVHNLDRNRAVAVVFIPLVFFVVLLLIFYFGMFLVDIVANGLKAAATSR